MHDSELIVRSRKQEYVFELLPTHTLDGDFPHAFAQDFAHWLNIETGLIEWRPLKDAWSSTPDLWQMWPGDQQEKYLVRGSSKLIDIHTPTAKAVSLVLSPLEYAAHIHITLSKTEVLEVHLPRLNLGFFLRKKSKQLESKQFRGMTVDANQSFGALTGLTNKPVLLGDNDSERSVIIPYGEVLFRPEEFHVRVHINLPLKQQRSYHIYQIDNQLGRLVDNGTLKSRLFKIYLHAVTSHCLPDELTGRSGTEEALYGLASSSICSFLRLEQTDIDLLVLLARLTPLRQYYPENLRSMQRVNWGNLHLLNMSLSTRWCVRFLKKQK